MTIKRRSFPIRLRRDCENLFVRLSATQLEHLQSDIIHQDDDDDVTFEDRSWKYYDYHHHDGDNDTTTFLPLELSFENGDDDDTTVIYASYNGGINIISSPQEDAVEIPDSLISHTKKSHLDNNNNNNNNNVVSVRALSSIRHCTRVQMDPRTVEDWELLEVHAQAFEEGGLLQQVSVIYQHQVLSLRLPRKQNTTTTTVTTVQLVVGEISTMTDKEEDNNDSLWPSLDSGDEKNKKDHETFALLVSDTEVIITPKPRPKPKNQVWSPPLRLVPCDVDWTEEMIQVAKLHGDLHPLVVPPGCILINEASIHNNQSNDRVVKGNDDAITTTTTPLLWAKISKAQTATATTTTDRSKSCWIRVFTSSQVPLLQAALHPWIRWDLDAALYSDSVQIQLSCEQEPERCSPRDDDDNDDVVLHPIHTEYIISSAYDEQPWRVPEMYNINNIGNTTEESARQKSKRQAVKGSSSVSLAIGSIVSSSFFVENDNDDDDISNRLFRLAIRSGRERLMVDSSSSSSLKIVALNKERFKQLLKEEEYTSIPAPTGQGGTTTTTIETIHRPVQDLTTWLSRPIVSSTEWSQSPLIHQPTTSRCTSLSICGPRGSGKTHAALLLGSIFSMKEQQYKSILYLDCARLQDSSIRMQQILEELCILFKEAYQQAHSSAVIILDDLDKLIPNLLGGDDEDDPSSRVQGTNPVAVDQSKAITDLIVHQLDALCEEDDDGKDLNRRFGGGNKGIITLISTCASANSLNHAFRECIPTRTLDVPVLSNEDRAAIFRQMLKASSDNSVNWDDVELPRLPESFRPSDIAKAVCRVQQKLWTTGTQQPHAIVESVLAEYIPISNMTLPQAKVTTGPDWNGIGGLFHVKAKLESTLLHPSRYRAIYSRANVRLPRGIMLFGPPGCGKSVLVPALAKECGFPLIACKGPEVLDKYIGASEAKVRELFDRAMAVAPSILFLDELDALAPRRGSDHTGVTDRVVNQLLTYLDGVEDGAKGTVYVIGATSRPDKIDPALLRPGRLEEHLFVGPPNTDEEWTDLFSKVSQGWNLSSESAECLFCNSERGKPTPLTRSGRFTPADFRACLDTAHVASVHRALASSSPDDLKEVTICKDDLQTAFATCKPCLSVEDAATQTRIYQSYGKHRTAQNDTEPFDSAAHGIGEKTTLR